MSSYRLPYRSRSFPTVSIMRTDRTSLCWSWVLTWNGPTMCTLPACRPPRSPTARTVGSRDGEQPRVSLGNIVDYYTVSFHSANGRRLPWDMEGTVSLAAVRDVRQTVSMIASGGLWRDWNLHAVGAVIGTVNWPVVTVSTVRETGSLPARRCLFTCRWGCDRDCQLARRHGWHCARDWQFACTKVFIYLSLGLW